MKQNGRSFSLSQHQNGHHHHQWKTGQGLQRLERSIMLSLFLMVLMSFWMAIQLHDKEQYASTIDSNSNARSNSLQIFSTNYTVLQHRDYSNGLWHNHPNIPTWLQDYMAWHHHVVTTELRPETKHRYNYLVLRCYSFDERCGGVSDRLKPVPLLLLAASQSKRIFFIHWYKRPCALEEFLQPPPRGLNWSVPTFLQDDFLGQKKGAITRAGVLLRAAGSAEGWIKHVHIHDAQGGSVQYDQVHGPDSFQTVFHDVFQMLFHPSHRLQTVIAEKMDHHRMVPGRYSVAHYRAEYGREVSRHPKLTEPSFIRNIAMNALRCAMELQPGDPIYFASDNMIALQTVQRIAEFTKYPIVTFDREESVVLRLDDTGVNYTNDDAPVRYEPKDYYSTFVDLYLAGQGDCTVFGRGGFGRFANLLSYNASCALKHVKQFFAVPCTGFPPLDKNEDEFARAGLKFA
jgi:hypothetical protein